MKKLIASILVGGAVLAGCSDANVVSNNIATAADQFEVNRRVVFYNGITADYILSVEGFCSVLPKRGYLAVVCQTGPDTHKQHYLGASDNVTWFAEQLEASKVSKYHYRVIFKPKVILPDIDLVN